MTSQWQGITITTDTWLEFTEMATETWISQIKTNVDIHRIVGTNKHDRGRCQLAHTTVSWIHSCPTIKAWFGFTFFTAQHQSNFALLPNKATLPESVYLFCCGYICPTISNQPFLHHTFFNYHIRSFSCNTCHFHEPALFTCTSISHVFYSCPFAHFPFM